MLFEKKIENLAIFGNGENHCKNTEFENIVFNSKNVLNTTSSNQPQETKYLCFNFSGTVSLGLTYLAIGVILIAPSLNM